MTDRGRPEALMLPARRGAIPWLLAGLGYTVRVPPLPGHGKTWKDMNRTRRQNWAAELDAALTDLRRQCDQAVPAGPAAVGRLALRRAPPRPQPRPDAATAAPAPSAATGPATTPATWTANRGVPWSCGPGPAS